jgi:hypothetical protein
MSINGGSPLTYNAGSEPIGTVASIDAVVQTPPGKIERVDIYAEGGGLHGPCKLWGMVTPSS